MTTTVPASSCARCTKEIAVCSIGSQLLCAPCGREQLYERACALPGDIDQHLPLLRALASRCSHVTEFGTRWANGSTLAFLAAQPSTLVCWDLEPECIINRQLADLLFLRGKTSLQPRCGNTLEVLIEPTDMLFIDTLHTAKQLLTELERHCDPKDAKVRKYIAFHDTATFGLVGEDGKPPGLRTAIRQFQRLFAFPLWELMPEEAWLPKDLRRQYVVPGKLDLENNNGLIVLRHVCADGHSPDLLRGEICRWCGRKVK